MEIFVGEAELPYNIIVWKLLASPTKHLFSCYFLQCVVEESMIVYDACRLIRERVPDAAQGQRELEEKCKVMSNSMLLFL